MKAEQCSLDVPVALTGNTLPLQRGKIAGPVTQHPSAGEVVVVEWGNGLIQKVTVRSLLSEEEAETKEAELTAEQEKIEQEFDNMRQSVRQKMTDAAKLLDEAAAICNKHGSDLVNDMYDEVRPLLRAMDRAGWSTSSLSC